MSGTLLVHEAAIVQSLLPSLGDTISVPGGISSGPPAASVLRTTLPWLPSLDLSLTNPTCPECDDLIELLARGRRS